jgi:hypothetical protein
VLARLHHKPLVGLLGLAIGFLTQPIGHCAYMLVATLFPDSKFLVAGGIGLLGFVLVGIGLKKAELPATLLGLVGGLLVWLGWFEFSFKYFADLYAVPPFAVEPGVPGGYVALPQTNVLQATAPLMLALFVIYGLFNRETRCNLIRWLHRRTRLNPGHATIDNGRSFARITAMELLFVTWFCYLFWLYMTYFGTHARGVTIIMVVYCAWFAWCIYLMYRSTKQLRTAAALRYGLGAGIVWWSAVEMPAHFRAYPEYWLRPFEFPIVNVVLGAALVAGLCAAALRAHPALPEEV